MKPRARKAATPLLALSFCCLGLSAKLTETWNAWAQGSPCPAELNQYRFPPGTTVYLDVNPPLRGTQLHEQINNAALDWSAANAAGNNSRVTFDTSTPLNQVPPGAPVLHVAVQAFQLNNGAGPDVHNKAKLDPNAANGIYLQDAAVYFNSNALANPFGSDGKPFYDPISPGYDSIYEKVMLHEIGHGMGLGHVDSQQRGGSVMNVTACEQPNDVCDDNPKDVTPCDNAVANGVYVDPPPPSPDPTPGEDLCLRCWETPIIVDVLGDGFNLTGVAEGVLFDFRGTGRPARTSWIRDDEALLALDRDGNGAVDNGAELFGNLTPQPPSAEPNGFLALAEYDKPQGGGNGDGVIGGRDAVFTSLRLWQDTNVNGISESGELHTLRGLGLESIALDYGESKRTDEHGNRFKYRAKVRGDKGTHAGRWAWDVFLVTTR